MLQKKMLPPHKVIILQWLKMTYCGLCFKLGRLGLKVQVCHGLTPITFQCRGQDTFLNTILLPPPLPSPNNNNDCWYIYFRISMETFEHRNIYLRWRWQQLESIHTLNTNPGNWIVLVAINSIFWEMLFWRSISVVNVQRCIIKWFQTILLIFRWKIIKQMPTWW